MSAQLLMVDDEPGLREAVKDYLRKWFHLFVASNASHPRFKTLPVVF